MPKKFYSSIILTVFLYTAFVLTFACQIGFPIFAIAQGLRSCCDCQKCTGGTYYTVNCELECGDSPKVGPLAIVRDADPIPITINAEQQQMLNLEVPPQKETRMAAWKKSAAPKLSSGNPGAKYATQVGNANEGAVTDKFI